MTRADIVELVASALCKFRGVNPDELAPEELSDRACAMWQIFSSEAEFVLAALESAGVDLAGEDAKRLHADKMRYHQAILWALGEWDDFPVRQDGEGAYYWRKELRARAAIPYHPPIDVVALPTPPESNNG